MEKRGLISLRGVLLRYLVQTVFCCVLALLLWFAALMCVINSGLALPAIRPRRPARRLHRTFCRA